MNILLVYATYSSGTKQASQVVVDFLNAKSHTVTVKKAQDTNIEDFTPYDLVILASPSWLINDTDGMPHEDFVALIERSQGKIFENKPFAIFGLGDESYAHFCGAVDHLKQFVEQGKGALRGDVLRIDGYLFNEDHNAQVLREWVENIISHHT